MASDKWRVARKGLRGAVVSDPWRVEMQIADLKFKSEQCGPVRYGSNHGLIMARSRPAKCQSESLNSDAESNFAVGRFGGFAGGLVVAARWAKPHKAVLLQNL